MSRPNSPQNSSPTGAAVLSMAACAAILIATEFMPVSVLSPLAAGLGATEGQAGQANSISGAFAVITSLCITTLGGNWPRRAVLAGVAAAMMAASAAVAFADGLAGLMLGRVFVGMAVGAFWSLSTATIMRLVAPQDVLRALSVMYLGQAVAATFAAPVATLVDAAFGWRAVFWGLVPMAGAVLIWQALAMPQIAGTGRQSFADLAALLRRRHVRLGLLGAMGSLMSSSILVIYMRSYLQGATGGDAALMTLMFTILGASGFVGTWAGERLAAQLGPRALPVPAALSAVCALGLVAGQGSLWAVALCLFVLGALATALSIIWMLWLAQNIDDAPELAGSLMVPALQISMMLGGLLGGALLDWGGITATYLASAASGILAVALIGRGHAMLKP